MDKNKMLIDATHPEETRVVVLRNGRVEEFDFESASRKLLRGNIYLAKVTRVEPSLQAAFVEYGGNRHGFLAFAEIHPDYYQIPIADRELLKQEEADAEAAAEAEADERSRQRESRRRRGGGGRGEHASGDRAERDAGRGPDFRPEFEDAGGNFEAGPDAPYDNAEALDRDQGSGSAPRRAEALGHDNGDAIHDNGDAVAYDRHAERDHAGDTPARSTPAGSIGQHAHADDAGRADQPFHADREPNREPGEHGHSSHAHGETHSREASSETARYDVEGSRDRGSDDNGSDDHGSDDRGNVEDVGGPDRNSNGDNGSGDGDQVEQVATGEDALEELPERPRRRARQYKIQEVIKRRQIILVQVVKEERGNKGAALTTYISLAGRYTVLMPNTGRGGGISRKITQAQDRKRLKAIAEDLEVSEGMGLIIRTAGAAQSKQEIKRDYEYLLRLWESVRDLTLTSTAPCLVYEEGNLIKRSIRDLYSKDIDDIQVAGPAAYAEASDFMGMLMPGHQDSVVNYVAPEPLFARFGIERQLNAMFNPTVTLRSGGYIVINQTEALVAIDVNSGKSTREFSIEETALNTNLEASEEIARQLKLRDLAGLIVVDFIDMEEKRNNRTVERRMKDALRHDRARIQVGRISHFGLLEMSRQRLRTGVVEGSTSQCPHCVGTGIIRSTESIALAVLRGIEDHLMKQPGSMAVTTNAGVALYILNNKRPYITDIERRFGISITVEASDRMHGANFAIERTAAALTENAKPVPRTAVSMDWGFDANEPDMIEEPVTIGRDAPREPRHSRERYSEERGSPERGSQDRGSQDRASADRDSQDRNGHERGGHERGGHERGGREHREPLEAREGRDEPRNQDEVRVEGDEAGRSRRRRRRRGRRDRVGGDDRAQVHREGAQHEGAHHEMHTAEDRGERPHTVAGDHDVDHARLTGHDTGEHSHEAGGSPAHSHDERGGADRLGGRDAGFEHKHSVASADIDQDGDDTSPGAEREPDAGGSDENRAKRGRRRGRRGGRSRGRDESGPRGDHGSAAGDMASGSASGAAGGDAMGGVSGERERGATADWGLVEVAQPGAEQPGAIIIDTPVTVPHDHRRGIVTTASEPVDHAPHFGAEVQARPSMVEPAVREASVREPSFGETFVSEKSAARVSAPLPAVAPVAAPIAAPVRTLETAPEPRHSDQHEPFRSSVDQTPAPAVPLAAPVETTTGPTRKGWWQRRFGNE